MEKVLALFYSRGGVHGRKPALLRQKEKAKSAISRTSYNLAQLEVDSYSRRTIGKNPN